MQHLLKATKPSNAKYMYNTKYDNFFFNKNDVKHSVVSR